MDVEMLKTPSGILKLWEIALNIIIISVTMGVDLFSFGSIGKTFFCGGVYIMALVVSSLLFLTYLRGGARDLQKTTFELKANFVTACLMVSAAGLTIHAGIQYEDLLKKNADAGKAAGSLAVFNALLYFADAHFARKNLE
ncbi:uncharacterized protein LOC135092511 [Scylla paramamosain]|uniref:uncharacterized protein LOC135092511 n=1 Tax=Scylla paramamosain TaxID=85552 RepID=UPI00308299B6